MLRVSSDQRFSFGGYGFWLKHSDIECGFGVQGLWVEGASRRSGRQL